MSSMARMAWHLVSWSRALGGMMILPPPSTSLLSPPGIIATWQRGVSCVHVYKQVEMYKHV